jgi:hypothetical protein
LADFVGAVMLALAVALLTSGILGTQACGWTSPQAPALVVVSLLLLAIFVERCRRVPSPALDLSLFSDANYRLAKLGAARGGGSGRLLPRAQPSLLGLTVNALALPLEVRATNYKQGAFRIPQCGIVQEPAIARAVLYFKIPCHDHSTMQN